MFNSETKTGLMYTHRIANQSNLYLEKETEIERFMNANHITVSRKFRDIGNANLKRPGLSELIKYLVGQENKIDLAVFYSFHELERDRIQVVMPRIRKYVTDIIVLSGNSGPLNSELIHHTLQQNEERLGIRNKAVN
ncbi:recombinase family protein [Oceanobacillus bengalensis]|uniref:Recombinase family protein n=1 Tax=Oceanobacillus bengalensis TaxID=1435466 RepID=A0A494Z568_9BACI|nr:recombinase family protein [Oceanobacillus bengalensis]RKQ17615.1 recombinase family protein [Oceanobacillus bengalensis]